MKVVSFTRTTEKVAIGTMALPGELKLLPHTTGVVVFSHGSDRSRFSSRNQFLARALQSHGLGTLLFDLLTEQEAQDPRNEFDIATLSSRIEEAVRWLDKWPGLEAMPIGLFGVGTGTAAALATATTLPKRIAAVVSRGGRPDLAQAHLQKVKSPTLLIVGNKDTELLAQNRTALQALQCEKKLEIVHGASRRFEEPGTLGSVAELAGQWFEYHLSPSTY
jgi:putative phosphoribosyl transferase